MPKKATRAAATLADHGGRITSGGYKESRTAERIGSGCFAINVIATVVPYEVPTTFQRAMPSA